jgi:arginine deiminase
MNTNLEIGVKAEWDRATEILVSTPGPELFYGVIYPGAACFEGPFNPNQAIEEHLEFRRVLEQEGIHVMNLRDVLSDNYQRLIELARSSLSQVFFDPEGKREVPELFDTTQSPLNVLPKDVLLRLVIEKTSVLQRRTPEGTYENEGYLVNPILNLYFQRDPMITTDKGVIIGNMAHNIRSAETDLVKAVLGILDIEPIHHIQAPGHLEGGDYIPAEEFALIGQGLRTNSEAIDQLMKSKVFGFKEVVVVHDPYQKEDEMHLDTYFDFAGKRKAVIVEDRTNITGKEDLNKVPKVTIYHPDGDGIYHRDSDKRFLTLQQYLESKEVELTPVTKEMQLNYGLNFLATRDSHIIVVKGIEKDYHDRLEKAEIETVEVPLDNLKKGYGGPHCMTQVLRRVEDA